MAARKYELYRVELGGGVGRGRGAIGDWQVDNGERVARSLFDIADSVTAYDARDVDPLVRAARLALKELDYAPPGESERDSNFRIQAKWAVQAALAPFDSEES